MRRSGILLFTQVLLARRNTLTCIGLAAALTVAGRGLGATIRATVEAEEVVTRCEPANNGAGPLWAYGSTIIARLGENVYASVIETGADVPPLCNTRWQLWHRSSRGWTLAQAEKEYRQREPCPIAVSQRGVFLSTNPSTQPPGTKYGPCHPLVLQFDPRSLAAAPQQHEPAWAEGTSFTDHSYRGFAADAETGEMLLLNIHARTGAQFVSHCTTGGKWSAKGSIAFPIRACYPQAALRKGTAHVMAIGDVVEPIEAWRQLKAEKTGNSWDYVFRRLFYTYTPDIAGTAFAKPIEIDTAEKTCGAISNWDLHVDAAGAAHLLYLRASHQYDFIRDRFFPGEPMTTELVHAVVKSGAVAARRTLLAWSPGGQGATVNSARFYVTPDGAVYVVAAGTDLDGGARPGFGNFIALLPPEGENIAFTRLAMQHPLRAFAVGTMRGGSRPSPFVDLLGSSDDSLNLRYAQIRLRVPAR